MNIGFYGPSTVCWQGSADNVSFVDQIAQRFNACIVNVGVPQGSEERILFELKKTRKLDVAIVFHTHPRYIFLPGCNRDVSLDCVKPRKAGLLWTESSSTRIPNQKEFEHEFFRYGGIAEKFKTQEEFVDSMSIMREYFHHPDLQMNRYQATLMAIDSYLASLNIPVFQSVVPRYTPHWLMPKTGTIDQELTSWNWTLTSKQNPHTPNNLTPGQNQQMADILSAWINKQCGSW